MATTRIMPLHIGKGRTASSAISDIIDYVQNPDKTDGGRLITGYACDSRTVDAEFMLAKREYISLTGRVRGAGYSKKFLAEHEADILLHKAAKKAFDELGVQKLPRVKELQSEYAVLLAEKKKAYAEYQQTRQEMQEVLTAKANVDRLLGTEEQNTEKERKRNYCKR